MATMKKTSSNMYDYKWLFKTKKKLVGQMYKIHTKQWKSENCSLQHKTTTDEDLKMLKLHSIFSSSYNEFYDFEPGTYTKLIVNDAIMMSDTPMEFRTNEEFMTRAFGNVLIGGLGIGLVLLAIQDKPEVKSITVIEHNKDIIKKIVKKLPLNDKVKIVEGDVYEWKPDKDNKFDVIYIDIWQNICSDNYEDMKYLKRLHRKWLDRSNENYWVGCWREKDCKPEPKTFYQKYMEIKQKDEDELAEQMKEL